MKLRGIARLAAATAATALLVAGFGSPAFAKDIDPDAPASAVLNIPDDENFEGYLAGTDTGSAVVGSDGWLFGKPEGRYDSLYYGFLYFDAKNKTLALLFLYSDG